MYYGSSATEFDFVLVHQLLHHYQRILWKLISLSTIILSVLILYNYCPCARVIWWFVHTMQVLLPEGMPEGISNWRGLSNLHITLVQEQQLFYYTEFLQLRLHWQQWCHQRVIVPARVIWQGNLIEYYPTITKTRLFKYTENFTTKKKENFQKKILIFLIFLLKT